jgi:cell wall-associated NlpC family hydrolase
MVRTTNQRGGAYFVVRPGGTSLFRVVLAGNGRVATSTSPAVRIRVSGGRGHAVVAEAARYRGAPYRYGGAGPRAFDCSGFTQFVYKRFGRKLPHSATAQSRYGAGVAKRAAQPGDLVLFGRGGRYYHAAIYAGRGYMWDASTEGRPVSKRRIYSQSFVVRRVI